MLFKPNNDHVNKRIYRLDEDVGVSIFIGYNQEVIIAGYDLSEVHHFESIVIALAKEMRIPTEDLGRFAFPEATLGHYVKEDYGTFDSFLDYIQFLVERSDV